jgi:cobalt-zinc-cadmium efflux system outer membrane protein
MRGQRAPVQHRRPDNVAGRWEMEARVDVTYRFRLGGLIIALCILRWGEFSPVIAQEPARRVSLAQAVALSRENSLGLRLARAELEERLGSARQSRAYFNPTVTVWHEALDGALDGEARDYEETLLSLDQTVEWPGRTAARLRGAARRIDSAWERFYADSLSLVFEVHRTFFEAALAEDEATILAETTGLLREAIADAETRFQEGDLSGYHLQRLRLELARYEGALASAELNLHAARRTLTRLLQPEVDGEIFAPDSLPRSLPPLVSEVEALSAVGVRPDIATAALDVEVERAAAQAASMRWIPDLTLSGGYKDQSDGLSGPVVGASLNLPLLDRGRGTARAARARHAASETRLALTRRVAELDLTSRHARYASALDRSDRVGAALLGDAYLLLSAARVSYAEGEMTLLELLDAVDADRDARLIASRLRAEAWIAYFDLVRAMGGEMLRRSEGEIQ